MTVTALLNSSLSAAKDKKIASDEVFDLYEELRGLVFGQKKAVRPDGSGHASQIEEGRKAESQQEQEQIEMLIKRLAQLNQDEKKQFSELLALDQVTLNTATSLERAKKNSSLKDYFETFIESKVTDGKGGIDAAKLGELIAVRQSLLLSIVHTMHPVVWHTPESKDFEWGMKEIGESVAGFLRQIPAEMGIPSPELGEFSKKIAAFIEKISSRNSKGKADFSVTPLRQVQKATVSRENNQEDENLERMKASLQAVSQAWNEAVDSIRAKHIRNTEISDTLSKLHFSADMDHVQLRQWGGSADADGRDASTSLELFRTIEKKTVNKKYEGPLLDLRQNAKVHMDLISGLIQHKYLSGDADFIAKCEKFAEGKFVEDKSLPLDKRIPYKAERNILQQLSDDDKKQFLKELIVDSAPKAGVVTRELKEQPRVFNAKFQEECKKLCEILSVDQYASLNELQQVEIPKASDDEATKKIRKNLQEYLGLENESSLDSYKNAFQVLEDRIKEVKFPGIAEKNSTFELSGLNYRAQKLPDGGRFFDKQKMLVGKEIKEMDIKTRFATLDVIKRLTVTKDALGKDLKIADRHQIANFSSEADFYSMMLLFKETGLMEIENGKVAAKPKLAIQPLLETGEDMRNAKTIFKNLLADPLARSYYEKMGKAHFMVGFSDGAKSAGNFASEWEIRQCKKDLYELFRKEFGPKFEIDILNGNGRGANRGGVIEGGTAMDVSPPEVQATAKLDRTIQGDEPFDLASSPSYAQEYFGSTIVGTMNAALRARESIAKMASDPAYKARMDAYEKICAFIADKSEKKFLSTVIKNGEYEQAVADKDAKAIAAQPAAATLKYTGHVPDNSLRASRDPKRPQTGDPIKDYDATRAITTEKASEKSGLIINEVGLKSALEAFETEFSNNEKWHVDGLKDPKAVLQKMYQEFDFFHTMVNKRVVNLNNYKPEMAEQYAAASGSQDYVKAVRDEIDGLKEKLIGLRGTALVNVTSAENIRAKNNPDPCEPIRFEAVDKSLALGKLANALILSHAADEKGKVQKVDKSRLNPTPEERARDIALADTIHNSEFAVAQALVAAQKAPERAWLRRQVMGMAA